MPTKKKRVGFIPREEVMKIIDKLSIENNLSNSKIISILVEEALSRRGMFNKRIGKAIQSQTELKGDFKDLSIESDDYKVNKKYKINTKVGNQKNLDKTTMLSEKNYDFFDLQTYKKFLLFLKFQEMMDDSDI